jgi:hypothetical protein
MGQPVSDLGVLLATLAPELHDGVFVYALAGLGERCADVPAIATFREAEGTTLILLERDALDAGLPVVFRAAWITLRVHSDLQAVGLTAAVARVLSDAGISCNVVAAVHHDHLFVPFERAGDAMRELRALQEGAVMHSTRR